jgi:hypothetical protein
MHEHFLEGHEAVVELLQPIATLCAPLVDATAAEFAFLEAEILQLIGRPHVFPVINIVQAERRSFDFAFNETPKNTLNAFEFGGEQAEAKFGIEVFGDDLGVLADFEDIRFAIHEGGYAVIALAGQFPDERAILRGDIDDFERRSRVFQNATLSDAERTPRKLNQFNHVIVV